MGDLTNLEIVNPAGLGLMQENDKLNVSQILIAIDARGCNRITLRHVVTLASDMKADIFGLYIEDTNLIHAAELPHTREVSLSTARFRELSSEIINRDLRDFANEMKAMLEEQAKLAETRATFKTARGLRIPTILEESKNANFIIIPASASWAFNHRDQQAIEKLPFVVFYDDSKQSQTILNISKALAKGEHTPLVFFTTDSASCEKLNKEFNKVNVTCQFINYSNRNSALNILRKIEPRMLIASESCPLIDTPDHLQQLTQSIHCDLVIVR